MSEIEILDKQESQEIELLERYLPALSDRNRAYLKGMAEALFYAQGGNCTTKVEHSTSVSRAVKISIRNLFKKRD